MANTRALTKRVAITKANAQMVAIVGVASFITIFCLVAAKAVWSQNSYQSRVIDATKTANTQLQSNISAYNELKNSYEAFVSKPTNLMGGQSSGSSNNSGNNAKVVLDALPPAYDFPALVSTVQNILNSQGLSVSGISGTDAELSEQTNNTSADPQPITMPFSFSIENTNYQTISNLVTVLQNSVRPMYIDSISMNGGGSGMTLSVTAHSYYEPAKTLSITKQVIK